MSADTEMDKTTDGGWRETVKIFAHALILAMIVRVFFFQPFNIPSGSMKQTLLIGDYLFVSKLSYGYSRYSFPWGDKIFKSSMFDGRLFADKPERGDVVVFKFPPNKSQDYIKRLIGMPGDRIQMLDGVLYINNNPVPKRLTGTWDSTECNPSFTYCNPVRFRTYEETLPNGVKYTVLDERPNGTYDDTDPFEVPPGHYFMMGDNRDNSADSRADVGFVPFENFIGRADLVFFSAMVDDPEFRLTRPWYWPYYIRWRRFFNIIR